MGKRLQVAFVGLDHWHASIHYQSFQEAGAQIVGGCVTKDFKASLHPSLSHCPLYPDIDSLVSAAHPDFIMAMAPHDILPALAGKLLFLGIPFGIEKPLGRNAKEVEPLVEQSEKSEIFCAVAFPNRYSALWNWVNQEKDSGSTISHAHFRIINGSPERYVIDGVSWMLDPARSGGGCLRNLGIHMADAFLLLTNGAPYKVMGAAMHRNVYKKPVEEYATALLVSETGAVVTIEAGYSFPTLEAGGDFEWRVSMEKSYFIDREQTLYIKRIDSSPEVKPNISQLDRYRAFAKDTLSRLQEGRPPFATIKDCFNAMLLIDRIYDTGVCS